MSRNKEFDRAFKVGQSFYGQNFGIKVVSNNLSVTRLGILISTKVSKKAVIRNRLRRQIREIIRSELINLKSGQDVVIIVFPQILDKNFLEIKNALVAGLQRCNLYK